MVTGRGVGRVLHSVVGELGGRQSKKIVGGRKKMLFGAGGDNTSVGLKAASREGQVSKRALARSRAFFAAMVFERSKGSGQIKRSGMRVGRG